MIEIKKCDSTWLSCESCNTYENIKIASIKNDKPRRDSLSSHSFRLCDRCFVQMCVLLRESLPNNSEYINGKSS